MDTAKISEHSRYVEVTLEHAFLADLLSFMWRKNPGEEIQVFNAEVDSHGFDVVLTFRGITRYVQLKTTAVSSSTRFFPINEKLFQSKAGCVLLMIYDPEVLKILSYRFFDFSNHPQSLTISSLRNARTTRANALGQKKLRRNTKKLPLSYFQRGTTIEAISTSMFPDNELAPTPPALPSPVGSSS